VTVVSPGVTQTALANSITDPFAKGRMDGFRKIAIPAEAIANAIAFAVDQPEDVDVSGIIVRRQRARTKRPHSDFQPVRIPKFTILTVPSGLAAGS
jgi:NADP-dependent 3-hydroxy acid dehydrogenase YdfG